MATSQYCSPLVQRTENIEDGGSFGGFCVATRASLYEAAGCPEGLDESAWRCLMGLLLETDTAEVEREIVRIGGKHSQLLDEERRETTVRSRPGTFHNCIDHFLYTTLPPLADQSSLGVDWTSDVLDVHKSMSWNFAMLVDGRPGREMVKVWLNKRRKAQAALYGPFTDAPCVFFAFLQAFLMAMCGPGGPAYAERGEIE